MKIYTIKVEDSTFELYWWEIKQLFVEKYQRLIYRVGRQGGQCQLTIRSIKPGLL